MKAHKKTRGRWVRELLVLLFAMILLSFLTVMVFVAAMGCGWSGSCSEYGFEVLLLLALSAAVSFIWFLVKFFKFLFSSQQSSQSESDSDRSTPHSE